MTNNILKSKIKDHRYNLILMIAILAGCQIALFGLHNTTDQNNNYTGELATTYFSDFENNPQLYEKASLPLSSKDFDNALWITDNRSLPKKDSLFYLDHPAPIFRKEFKAQGKIKKATLYITSAG